MRRAALLLALATLLGAEHVEAQDGHAFVEIATARDAYYVHEPIPIVIRVGVDAEFLRTNVIQATRQQLDLPVQLEATFLRDPPGRILPDPAAESRPRAARKSLALDDAPADAWQVADRVVAGRTFTVVELVRRLSTDRPGRIEVPGPVLRFAYALRFDEDLVGGRVPVDRREGVVEAKPLSLTIRPLPEEGRPPSFTGAVGRFAVRAEAEPRDLQAGASLALTLTISGDGDVAAFAPPRLEAVPGFKNRGVIEHSNPSARVLTYDLAPADETVRQVPPIAFSFFEPEPRQRYRTIYTAPIPITVRPGAASTPVARPPEEPTAAKGPEPDVFDLKEVGLERAEKAYRSGRYAEARDLFQRARSDPGIPAGPLLYDLGNAFFRLEEYAEAILHYRRAQLRLPRDPEVRANLAIAERRLETSGRRRPALAFVTPGELAIAAALLGALGIAGLFVRRRAVRFAALAAIVLGLVAGARAAQLRWLPGAPDAVVLQSEIALRGDPHREIPVALRLTAGEVVRVVEMTDRWARVIHPRGEGWTERQGIGIVD